MKNINDCLKSIAQNYGWKYLSYDNGKLIQLINRVGKSVAVYGHYFPLNSDTVAKICNDRNLTNKILSTAGIPTEEYLEVEFTSVNRVVNDLEPLLDNYKEIVIKSILKNDKLIEKISNKDELYKFATTNQNRLEKVLAGKHMNYSHFYSIYLVNGATELAVEYIRPKIVGDGASTIWELLSLSNIDVYDENIDLNQVPEYNETIYTSWQYKTATAKHILVNDKFILDNLTSLSQMVSSVIGVLNGTFDICECDGKYYIQSVDTSLNADMLLSNQENVPRVMRLYEKAIRLLI